MTQDSLLTPEDYMLLGRGALLAGGMVALSRYSGAQGTAKEFAAIADELETLRSEQAGNPVFDGLPVVAIRAEAAGLARDFNTDPTQKVYQDFKLSALNRLSQALERLAEKATPEQAAAYRAGVLRICQRVAETSTEGGFLGIGGARVDFRETGAVDEVRRVLGL
jgi:hypothetical protein